MKISYAWLNNYLNLELPADQLATLLTDIGLEVESVKQVESIKGGLKGVVIGQVLTKIQHPNADRLAITTVNVGAKDSLQIVCGAPNVAPGQKVPVATVGTIIYNGAESFTIQKSKIRGETSEGMICGADELGIGEPTGGIMVLDTKAKVGMPASAYFQLESDTVTSFGIGGRYYMGSMFAGVGYQVPAEDMSNLGIVAGYSKMLTDNIALEPSLMYIIQSAGGEAYGSTFGLNVGFALYF